MDKLSPAALAVLDACRAAPWFDGPCLAAALRAAADAVSPEAAPHRRKIRAELLAIAAELEEHR